jgi:predicted class III extradiol MEMO1 family dioxygenase
LNFLQITLSNYNNTGVTVSGNVIIRAVIISASNKMGNPNVNWNNYAEVKDKFKLKD